MQMKCRILDDAQFSRWLETFNSLPEDKEVAHRKEIETMQGRFRSLGFGKEDVDWEFPSHIAAVPVFYLYLITNEMYRPELPQAISAAMAGYEKEYVGQFECIDPPGKPGGVSFVGYDGTFLLWEDANTIEFAAGLGLRIDT